MQRLLSRMRAAIEEYDMIRPGDCVAACVSGGKDSVALLAGLAALRRFYPVPFTLKALTLDMGFDEGPRDYAPIEALCEDWGVEYQVKRTQIGKIIFQARKEENPCSLCARMRRGALHDAAKAMGCSKLAFGHHLDDAAQTVLLNVLYGGRFGCFSPVTYLSRKEVHVLRPMVFAFERDVARAHRALGLPVLESGCPADGHTSREQVKQLLHTLDKTYGGVREKLVGALRRSHTDGW